MQREARNRKKRHFGALCARLCALHVQDQLENLTNCPLLIATHSDFYASTLKNARGSQKLQKEGFWRASREIARAARAGSKNKPRHPDGLFKPVRMVPSDLKSSQIWCHFIPENRTNGGDPPVLFPLRTRLKKGTSSLRSEVNKL